LFCFGFFGVLAFLSIPDPPSTMDGDRTPRSSLWGSSISSVDAAMRDREAAAQTVRPNALTSRPPGRVVRLGTANEPVTPRRNDDAGLWRMAATAAARRFNAT
jgi:hypothetical protein